MGRSGGRRTSGASTPPVSPRRGPERRSGNERRADAFTARVAEALGISPSEAFTRLATRRRTGVRINQLSPLPADEIRERARALGLGLEPVDWCPDAYLLDGDKRLLTASDLFADGHLYIQNLSSLVPALALGPRPGERILDLCAAPGGKTAHIAALTGNQAELWANDGIAPRLEKLRGVTAQFHVRLARLTGHPAQFADRLLDATFDRVLLDAQCSGEGLMNPAEPVSLRYWSEERITRYGYLQRKMLVSAFRLLRPGGTLVYSTCTFGPEENEAPVSFLLRHHPVEVVPIDIPPAPDRQPGRRSWRGENFDPGVVGAARVMPGPVFEGFFVCALRKRSDH
jgi:16S rRNA (cytosine1407-C5)-methyltransferase